MEALKYPQVSVNMCNLVSAAEFLHEDPEQAPSQGAIGCTAPTTNLAEPTGNLRNIKDRHADQI